MSFGPRSTKDSSENRSVRNDAGIPRSAVTASCSWPKIVGPAGVELSWFLIVPVQLAMNRYLHGQESDPLLVVEP
jgi:hypothetical protein